MSGRTGAGVILGQGGAGGLGKNWACDRQHGIGVE
jgi:hypothetical protein